MSTTRGPIALQKDHEVIFGFVDGEYRGTNPINPPRRRNDPFFWLRDDSRKSPEVIAHLKLEQAFFEERTADIKDLAEIVYNEHISHIQETDMSAPYKYGNYLYYTREVKDMSYKIYCRVPVGKTPGENSGYEEVLLDVNKLAEGKSFCVVQTVKPAPPDHIVVAYSVDYIGEEVYTICLLNNKVTDVVEGTNGAIVWGMDSSSFFYVTKDSAKRDNKVWRHVIGRPQAEDVCLYTDDDQLFSVFVGKSSDGNTLFIGSESSETTEIHLLDLRKDNNHTLLEPVRLREKGVRYNVELHGTDTLMILTNKDNCINGKVVLTNRNAAENWDNVIVCHSNEIFITDFIVLAKFAVFSGRRDGLTRIWTMRLGDDGTFNGAVMKEVSFDEPIFTTYPVFSHMQEYNTETLRLTYSSMTTPTTWFDMNVISGEFTTVKVREVCGGFDSKNYVCRRLFAIAPDRTRIPLSVVHHIALDMSKPHPTMLYAYGSYGICMEPEFGISYLPYVDRGIIYAIAHVRGGGEMGRAWYEVGGKYLTKRNTFSDFIASAEYLIESGITTASQLACEGRSAGGLLIGAVLNMRPDLFCVALAGVPFVDVMTTMSDPSIPLTTGEWEEWGNSNEYKFFDYINSYSPIDNVRPQEYPHIMIQAGLHDPRVAYWEPVKWASKLRLLKTDNNEVLLKMDLDSGHFSASDRYKYWRDMAIQQSFVLKHLGARLLLRK